MAPIFRIAMTLVLFCSACSESAVLSTQELNARIAGQWMLASDDLVLEVRSVDGAYVDLALDGSGFFYGVDDNTGVLTCIDVLYSVLNDNTLFFELNTFVSGDTVRVFDYTLTDSLLTVSNDSGASSSFESVSEIPGEVKCKEFEVATFEFPGITPENDTDLVYDGSVLWFGDRNRQLQQVDPETGTVGTPLELPTTFPQVIGVEGPDFWLLRSDRVEKRNASDTVLDMIEFSGDLAVDLSARAGTWDGTHLWVHGAVEPERVFLQIDPDTKTLVTDPIVFDRFVTGLGWDGSSVWAFVDTSASSALVSIDPDTFTAADTYLLPLESYRGYGVASVGPDLYLLVRAAGTKIIQVTP